MKFFLIFLCFSFLCFSSPAYGDDSILSSRKIQGLAIGEISLAYRLLSLSASLSVAKAADNTSITALLKNIDKTLANAKNFFSKEDLSDSLSREIILTMDDLLSCSATILQYSNSHSYEVFEKVRKCVDDSEKKIEILTEKYNAGTSDAASKQSKQPQKKGD